MAYLIDLLSSLGIFVAMLAAAAGIVYLPYWVLMRLFRSSSAFYFRRSCRPRTYRQHTFRSYRKTHTFRPNNTPSPEPSAYEILRCTPNDDNETIKKRYRALVKQYHPDHISREKKDEVALENAKIKMQQINDAYEAIKRVRGLKR